MMWYNCYIKNHLLTSLSLSLSPPKTPSPPQQKAGEEDDDEGGFASSKTLTIPISSLFTLISLLRKGLGTSPPPRDGIAVAAAAPRPRLRPPPEGGGGEEGEEGRLLEPPLPRALRRDPARGIE